MRVRAAHAHRCSRPMQPLVSYHPTHLRAEQSEEAHARHPPQGEPRSHPRHHRTDTDWANHIIKYRVGHLLWECKVVKCKASKP